MMSKDTLNYLIKLFFWGAVLSGAILLAASAHGTTTSGKQNSLGFVQYASNPLMYQAANLADRPDAVTNIDGNLNLSIKPVGTSLLYDESILFCGLPIDKFQGVGVPFLLTYERQAHRTVQGVGCHNLIRVDTILPKTELK